MKSEDLKDHISSLVDRLREDDNASVTLPEVAAATEVLLSTMRRYFYSIDTDLYREFRFLSEYIDNAKGEIAKLRPTEIKGKRLPRAGRQFDAVVKATEEASQTIMEAAAVTALLPRLRDAFMRNVLRYGASGSFRADKIDLDRIKISLQRLADAILGADKVLVLIQQARLFKRR